MKPDNSVIRGGIPAGGTARALVEPGKAYAIYVRRAAATVNLAWGTASPFLTRPSDGSVALQVALPAGPWHAEWLDTETGKTVGDVQFSGPGVSTLGAPAFTDDIALRMMKG